MFNNKLDRWMKRLMMPEILIELLGTFETHADVIWKLQNIGDDFTTDEAEEMHQIGFEDTTC